MPKQGGQDPMSSGPRGEPRNVEDGTDPGGRSVDVSGLPTTGAGGPFSPNPDRTEEAEGYNFEGR